MNRTLAERLAFTLQEEDQRDWDLQLPEALAAIRSIENYNVINNSRRKDKGNQWL